jgi:hypothetical protein
MIIARGFHTKRSALHATLQELLDAITDPKCGRQNLEGHHVCDIEIRNEQAARRATTFRRQTEATAGIAEQPVGKRARAAAGVWLRR